MFAPIWLQCCPFFVHSFIRLICLTGEPRTATSTFTQLLTSDSVPLGASSYPHTNTQSRVVLRMKTNATVVEVTGATIHTKILAVS